MNLIINLLKMQKMYNASNIFIRIALIERLSWVRLGYRFSADATLSATRIVIDVESAGDNSSFVLGHELAHVEQLMNPFNERDADKRALEMLEEVENDGNTA